jgi:hypothetical protein
MVNHQLFQLLCSSLTRNVRPLTFASGPHDQAIGQRATIQRSHHPVVSYKLLQALRLLQGSFYCRAALPLESDLQSARLDEWVVDADLDFVRRKLQVNAWRRPENEMVELAPHFKPVGERDALAAHFGPEQAVNRGDVRRVDFTGERVSTLGSKRKSLAIDCFNEHSSPQARKLIDERLDPVSSLSVNRVFFVFVIGFR